VLNATYFETDYSPEFQTTLNHSSSFVEGEVEAQSKDLVGIRPIAAIYRHGLQSLHAKMKQK
jgi:hypothetical protein